MFRNRTWVLFAVITSGLAVTAAPPVQVPQPEPRSSAAGRDDVVRPTNETHYMLLRGAKYRLGQFDQDGNFVPYPHITRMNGRPM